MACNHYQHPPLGRAGQAVVSQLMLAVNVVPVGVACESLSMPYIRAVVVERLIG